MRLKIHESTVKSMAKMLNAQKIDAVDDLGNRLEVYKRGHFVVITVTEESDWGASRKR